MTNYEIELVKRSWKRLDGVDPILLGDVFYSRLFLDNPSLEKMFKISKQEQAKKLIDMLDTIIKRLDNLTSLTDEIKAMAQRHVGYGVKPKHYLQVGEALIWTLSNGLGKDWDQETEKAWLNCYTLLANAMIEA
ncbi:MAG: globin domain-containing protein [Spirosomataceae bacterium]